MSCKSNKLSPGFTLHHYHPIGMLDRDQRTAKIPTATFRESAPGTCFCANDSDRHRRYSNSNKCFNGDFSETKTLHQQQQQQQQHHHHHRHHLHHRRQTRCRNLGKVVERVKQVLIVGTYLLSIIKLPANSLSAPVEMTARFTDAYAEWWSPPKWINPLKLATVAAPSETVIFPLSASRAAAAKPKDPMPPPPMVPSFMPMIPQHVPATTATTPKPTTTNRQTDTIPKEDLLQHILDQSKLAFNSANNFLVSYVRSQWGQTPAELNSAMYVRYPWLPSESDIPKQHLDVIPPSDRRIAKMTMENLVVNVYEQLQKIAVGMEQIVWNLHESKNNKVDLTHLAKFRNMELELQMVLIELQVAIQDLGLQARPDVLRYAMPESARDMDATGRVTRDWVIFRDYLNTLEYIIQALSAIKKREFISV